MKAFNILAVKTALIGVGVLLTSFSQAYVVETCENNENKRIHWRKPTDTNHPAPSAVAKFKLSEVFGENSTEGLETAKQRWNSTPAAIVFNIDHGDTSVGFNNYESEIWWSSTRTSKPAEAFIWAACAGRASGAIQEVDIIFNSNYADEFYRGESKSQLIPYGGTKVSFISTAMQEMGRAIGLGYVTDVYSLMNKSATNAHFQTNGNYARAYVGEDTIDGVLDIYGSKYLWKSRNVGASHWKINSETGKHEKTKIYNEFEEPLSTQKIEGEPHFKVVRGKTYAAEFTFENLTYYGATVDVGIYISTNDNITREDRLIRTLNDVELNMNSAYTRTVAVTIPSDLQGDRAYYVGAIVNYNYTLVQNNNNEDDAAYLPIVTD